MENEKPDYVHQAEAEHYKALAVKNLAEAELMREQLETERLRKENLARDVEHNAFKYRYEMSAGIHNGIYRFWADVNDNSVKDCIRVLDYWEKERAGSTVTIIFTSPGGLVVPGMALWDRLMEFKKSCHLVTVAQGWAASMAGILLQAGHERKMGREAYVLIHQVQAGMMGSFGELEDRMKWLTMVQNRILDIFASRASNARGKPFDEVRKFLEDNWTRTDWWLNSDQAYEIGIVDEVID